VRVSLNNYLYGRKSASLLIVSLVISYVLMGLPAATVHAEGTGQLNEAQTLNASTVVYADISTVGQTINVSVCNNTNISIWNTNGTPSNTGDDTVLVTASAFTANLACGSALPNPITGAYEYTPAAAGTYRIQISSSQARYDFSVTANNTTDPNPTVASGRIWSYTWNFSTGSFAQASATDADLYVLVPASNPSENFVWKLDLNEFTGNGYSFRANRNGLDAPYSGISAPVASSSITPQYPIYLGYPAIAGSGNTSTPTITNARFVDDDGEDSIFSPNGTVGVQDTGDFIFDTNVNNANYAITVDTNQDGVFGTGDRLLLGAASNGTNTVNWDGKYPNGSPVSSGVYSAQIQIRTGEYHFIAQDVETSGGTTDGGTTWSPGLAIFRAIDASTTENTKVYWDDETELSSDPDATSNVPDGVTSGSTADADSDGKPDGFHTWGNFTSSSVGNDNNIDTYVYGPSVTATVNIAVAPNETGDSDGVTSSTELSAGNFGDGNGDGTDDYLQNDVTSLPNPVTGKSNTLAASGSGCNAQSSVSVKAENQLSKVDQTYDYPQGLFNFTVNCGTPGATANITVYYDKVYDTSTWVARKFNNGVYTNIPGAVFGTATVGGSQVTTMTYAVTDGSALDADGTVNGTIVDPAGPGVLGASTAASTVGVPNTGLAEKEMAVAYLALIVGLGLVVREVYAVHTKRKAA
jgi:hypothetical protein